jgi:heme oxygenase
MKLHKIINFLRSKNFKKLATVNQEEFVYRESDLITDDYHILVEEKSNDDDLYIYGWIIEENFRTFLDNRNFWSQHWKRKIYTSKDSALDAINQFRISCSRKSSLTKDEFRIKPLYSFKNNGWRNHIINKIILDK